ncbi:hypothetical protein NDU88_003082 [Pleurodeles waltl]|uniref:Uncharacterized protein n=1 Tax=Pleurodeles waltl TaxID=8319 RepID=A0AAV7QBR5_PLEWA|nr:hypothetical protein NDU88_003082 [Pleurodeles waltl]
MQYHLRAVTLRGGRGASAGKRSDRGTETWRGLWSLLWKQREKPCAFSRPRPVQLISRECTYYATASKSRNYFNAAAGAEEHGALGALVGNAAPLAAPLYSCGGSHEECAPALRGGVGVLFHGAPAPFAALVSVYSSVTRRGLARGACQVKMLVQSGFSVDKKIHNSSLIISQTATVEANNAEADKERGPDQVQESGTKQSQARDMHEIWRGKQLLSESGPCQKMKNTIEKDLWIAETCEEVEATAEASQKP